MPVTQKTAPHREEGDAGVDGDAQLAHGVEDLSRLEDNPWDERQPAARPTMPPRAGGRKPYPHVFEEMAHLPYPMAFFRRFQCSSTMRCMVVRHTRAATREKDKGKTLTRFPMRSVSCWYET